MKKFLIILLCITLTVSFSGCDTLKAPSEYSDLPDEYNFGTDYPSSFAGGMGITKITPTEDGYYFFAGGFLYFFDKETQETVLTCHRPECRHWDVNCSGYYQRSKHSLLQYYEGKLYAVIDEPYYLGDVLRYHAVLYVIDPTQGVREKICQLPYETTDLPQYMIHRGYLYMVYFNYADREFTLERVAMNELKEKSLEPELIFSVDAMGFAQQPLIYGEHCILGYVLPNSANTINMRLFDFNLKTGEQREIVFPGAEEGSMTLIENVSKDGLLLTYASPELVRGEAFDRPYYSYDPTTGEMDLVMELKDRGEGMTEYLYWDGENWIVTYLDQITNRDDFFRTNQEIRFYDENLELQETLPIDFCVQGAVVGDEDYMFIGDVVTTFELYAIDKRDGKFEVVEVLKAYMKDIILD